MSEADKELIAKETIRRLADALEAALPALELRVSMLPAAGPKAAEARAHLANARAALIQAGRTPAE